MGQRPVGSAIAIQSGIGIDKSISTPLRKPRVVSKSRETVRTNNSRQGDNQSARGDPLEDNPLPIDNVSIIMQSQLIIPNTQGIGTLEELPHRNKRSWSTNTSHGRPLNQTGGLKSILSNSSERNGESTGSTTPNLNILRKKVAFSKKIHIYNLDYGKL